MNFIRDLHKGDLRFLAENLRDADKQEVLANSDGLLAALEESVRLSYFCKIIDISGKPAGIFGVCRFTEGRDAIWMLGTDELAENSVTFVRHSRPMIKQLFDLSGAEQFVNYTYAKNVVHHRWLKYCKAIFSDVPLPIGNNGQEFFTFVINRSDYV